MAGSQAHVTAQDAQNARDLVENWAPWLQDLPEGTEPPAAMLQLRGMLAALLADVRDAAYLEGVVTGRRQVGDLITDALRGEGLA